MSNQPEKELFKAPEFTVNTWIDTDGNKTTPIKLSTFKGKFKIVFCFQYWCSGCHSKGLPDLKKIVDALEGNANFAIFAIQTVFEGYQENTFDKIVETQKKYKLNIPFGHDADIDGKSQSTIMTSYKTNGTPWFILIDKHNNVVFSDFHLNPDAAIAFFKTLN